MWPEWWSSEAEDSLSAQTDLRFTIARRLGIAPGSLFDGPPVFLWGESARFKNLGTQDSRELSALTSFGVAVGRCAIQATPEYAILEHISYDQLRRSILSSAEFVSLDGLLTFCWAVGLPAFYLRVFPLARKRMHAMTTRVGDRFCILLSYKARYQAQAAFTLAHEIAHVLLGHVPSGPGLVELHSPLSEASHDVEERQANDFAIGVLTGDPNFHISSDTKDFSSTQLAAAAQVEAPRHRIDPGILALTIGKSTDRWRQTFGALQTIDAGQLDIREQVNSLAITQFRWSELSFENRSYLRTVLGVKSAT